MVGSCGLKGSASKGMPNDELGVHAYTIKLH